MTQSSVEFLELQRAVVGRFSLEREVGRGGMGIVFLARDVALDRPVAIKLLPLHLADQHELRERFLREARTAARLSHPNIVPIYQVEEQGSLVYFVMAFVDGQSLGERIRRDGRLTPTAVRRLVQELAWALGYAHQHGVVHRDIKPDNILLEKATGRAMVTDFGIARQVEADSLTARGEIVGTVYYMSPEQATGDTVDGRSDLYALGVTAFYALTGHLPFTGNNVAAVIHQHVSVAAPRVAAEGEGVPARLAEAVDRCLAKDPARRWPSGEALAEAIGEAGVMPQELSPPVRSLMRLVRRGAAGAAVIGTLALFVFVAAEDLGPFLLSMNVGGQATLAIMAWLVLIGYPMQLLKAARRVLRDGHDAEHVRQAMLNEAGAIVEELRLKKAALAALEHPNRELLIRWSPVVGFIGLGLVFGGLVQWDTSLLVPGVTVMVLGAAGFGAGPTVEKTSPIRALGWVERLMLGRFGETVFRLAAIGLGPTAPRAPELGEHTEVVLASALTDLFEQLPSPVRRRLAEVPDLIHRLEQDARALRHREETLADALARVDITVRAGDAGSRTATATELENARAAVRERLATAVAALENLRLGFLRLLAGVSVPDDLTADIERARAVGEAIDLELAARNEVNRLLGTSLS